MSKELETELTFLCASLPVEINGLIPIRIEDIYIPEKHDFSPLRLRKQGNTYVLTRKMPVLNGDYSAHIEHTIPLEKDIYNDIKRLSNKSVVKDRYEVAIDGYNAHVDVFLEELSGLVLVEFEFPSIEEMSFFKAPACCLKDVTQERTILGGQLAGKKYSDIERWLKEQGYKKLA